MAEYLHKISELRNRFRYDPDTGWIFWRDLPFIDWARGHTNAKQGHYMRWRREKAGKRVIFSYTTPGSVARLRYRGVSYTGPRLAWALHYGVHPEADEKITTVNGDSKDLAARNLAKVSARDFYRSVVGRVKEARRSDYRGPQVSWLAPAKLALWFSYDPDTGDILWQHISWPQWRRLHRGRQAGADSYETYLKTRSGTPVEFRKDRRGDQVVTLKTAAYERKLLSYALVEGEHIPDICYLYHMNGDPTDFRWENIGMTYRDDIDPEAD